MLHEGDLGIWKQESSCKIYHFVFAGIDRMNGGNVTNNIQLQLNYKQTDRCIATIKMLQQIINHIQTFKCITLTKHMHYYNQSMY